MAIWAFPCEIYLFATNICEISDSIANFEKKEKDMIPLSESSKEPVDRLKIPRGLGK